MPAMYSSLQWLIQNRNQQIHRRSLESRLRARESRFRAFYFTVFTEKVAVEKKTNLIFCDLPSAMVRRN